MRSQLYIIAIAIVVLALVGLAPHAVAGDKSHLAGTEKPRSVGAQKKPLVGTDKPSAFVSPAETENAYIVNQKHYFLGRWQISVNGDKVKTTNLSEGYSIVTMAPTWKVVFFRDSGAKMYETTMKSFMLTGLPLSSGYVIEGRPRESGPHKAVFKGLNTILFSFDRVGGHEVKPAWTLADVPKESPVKESDYWVCPMVSKDRNLCNFVQKLFMVPSALGYPVAFVDARTDGSKNSVLDILSCKRLPAAEVPITYPSAAKYKVCNGIRDVTLSTAKRDTFNEWAQNFGKE